jgi:hypothetical protein
VAVVEFLQRLFDFADTLSPAEGRALRRIVRAGLLADDGTIEAVLTGDVSGFSAGESGPEILALASAREAWYFREA